ncbi:MAG: phosphoribosylamine--glycine ligase [Bacillota bacterium]
MNVLVIGSGGREHALVWKLSRSPKVEKVYCVPGNGGIQEIAECVDMDIMDFSALTDFARANNIELTVVGPEAPLTEGIVNAFRAAKLPVFGPSKEAAVLEGSKAFAKEFMKKYGIPTADYASFTKAKDARDYLSQKGVPCVVKADGLAAGKGVVVAMSEAEALKAVDDMMEAKVFGSAGNVVVIEEYLEGPEVSVLALTDGINVIPLLPAQDHKRVFDGDKGPNTGGMGAYAPAPVCDSAMLEVIRQQVLEPAVRGMREEGRLFKGVLYAGLMLTKNGPKVLEFNVRFGDPETQPIMMLLESDLVDLCQAVIEGSLEKARVKWHEGFAVCVVLASGGYPGAYAKGKAITLGDMPEHTMVFHAGTVRGTDGTLLTSGGRVLGVTAAGQDVQSAIQNAYHSMDAVHFEGMHYRRDIGSRAL